MGRKSGLSEDQWNEVVRLSVVEGLSNRELAERFGSSETAVRRNITARAETIKKAGKSMALAQAEISALPISAQIVALDFASSLRDISKSLCAAAANGASNAARLQAMAAIQINKIDPEDPMAFADNLQAASGLTKLANEAGKMGTDLLNANKKDTQIDPPMQAKPLSAFYGKTK